MRAPSAIEVDEAAIAYATLAQEAGFAGFAIRTTESGDVRVAGLALPAGLIVKMLRAAADVYEGQAYRDAMN